MSREEEIDPGDTARGGRSIRLERSPALDGVGVFRVTTGQETTYYTLCEIPCQIGGRGFAVHRLGLGQLYHVRVGSRTIRVALAPAGTAPEQRAFAAFFAQINAANLRLPGDSPARRLRFTAQLS